MVDRGPSDAPGLVPEPPDSIRGLLAELQPLITGSPLLHSLGGDVVAWGPGWAEVRLPTGAGFANIAGTVHGAVTTAAADCAFETACNSYGRIATAISLTGHFTAAPAAGTTLRAVAREVSRSRSVASYRIEVTETETESTRLVAWYQAVAHRSAHWHLGAERWPDGWRDEH
jgi:acyl-CoA thioesterase